MSEADKLQNQIGEGKVATIMSEQFGAVIAELKGRRLEALKSKFRQGKVSQEDLLVEVAGIVAYDDLEAEIKRKITRGNIASHELNKGATNA